MRRVKQVVNTVLVIISGSLVLVSVLAIVAVQQLKQLRIEKRQQYYIEAQRKIQEGNRHQDEVVKQLNSRT